MFGFFFNLFKFFNDSNKSDNYYYIEKSRFSDIYLYFIKKIFNITVKKLSWKYSDLKKNGTLLGLKLYHYESENLSKISNLKV